MSDTATITPPDRTVPLPQTTPQLVLLDVPAAEFVAKLEAKGDYTGERLKAQKPETYQRVIVLLAQGHGAQYIQDQTGVSKNTVKAVRKAEGETIDLVKARLADNSFDLADQANEAAAIIINEIMSSPTRRSVLSMKDAQAAQTIASNAITNGQLLTGKPTANVSVEVFSKPSEDLNAAIAEHIAGLKSAATHSGAEKNSGQISESAALAGPQHELNAPPAPVPGAPLIVEIEAVPKAHDDGQSAVTPT